MGKGTWARAGIQEVTGSNKAAFLLLRALGWKRNNSCGAISVDKDAFKLVDTGNSFARYFARIPTPKGRIWCPLRMWDHHEALLAQAEVSDSKLRCKGDRFFLHITIKREVKPMRPSRVLAVDLGERFLAASVALSGGEQ